jgi:hypothetical protein
VKITAVTPTDAAADPLHPDHDRWVKERTLAMEVAHAQRMGLSLRHAETENAYWLQRAEAKARESTSPAVASPSAKKRKTRAERLAERPVVVKAAKPERKRTLKDLSPCGRCGLCRACKREKRIYALAIKARNERDPKLMELIKLLWLETMQASSRTGKFQGMSTRDANRIIARRLEDICDSTIPAMGEWK